MNYYAVERSTDHLAHYGVKGMRWGVRKAVATGNQKALDRHYRKAAKKLAKLQDIGINSKKYAAKSIAYGAAAAGTGTLAAGGFKMISNLSKKPVSAMAENFLKKNPQIKSAKNSRVIASTKYGDLYKQYYNIVDTPKRIENFGNTHSVALGTRKSNVVLGKDAKGNTVYGNKLITLTNNDLYRIGLGTITAGLAAKSAQNAYRASNGKKYREKAMNWKREMDDAFSGTPYAGHYEKMPKRKRRRK